MSWLVTVAVLGFDLERGRRLAHDHPPPPSLPPTPPSPPSPPPVQPPYAGCDYIDGGRSCDDDYTNSCDEQSENGKWDRSCDLHPSTSCDDWSGCKYDPPPPLAPAPPGGYSPPPEPPPEDDPAPRIIFWTLLGVAIVVLIVCCGVLRQYRTHDTRTGARGRFQYWFCCCVECCRYSNWHQNELTNRPYDDDRPKVVSEQELDQRDKEIVESMGRELEMRVAAAVLPTLSLST